MSKGKALVVVSLFAVILVAVVAPARATDVGAGFRLGTQGAGAEVGVGFTEWFTLRGGYYAATVSESVNESGIDYDGDLNLGGLGVLADFFPLRGKFRLTAGLFSNDTEIELLAIPTLSQEIGGTVYTPAEIGTLSGNVEFDGTAPYFGIGWGNVARGNRLGFLFDLGVLAQGDGDVRLATTGTAVTQADLDLEARQLEADIDGFDLWPVISVGLSIRF